jgi:hypothetical protein
MTMMTMMTMTMVMIHLLGDEDGRECIGAYSREHLIGVK